ncbi:hypothetical protein, partial [Burkholderia sp. E168m23]|uniref:hypothetical protein n=1 Tax=Burkholderia sp. E168m23 TaxID=1561200 RepID=UPI001F27042C
GQEGTLAAAGIVTFERRFVSWKRRCICGRHPVREIMILPLAEFGQPKRGVPALRPKNGKNQCCCAPD